jgi:hypothetical protein
MKSFEIVHPKKQNSSEITCTCKDATPDVVDVRLDE